MLCTVWCKHRDHFETVVEGDGFRAFERCLEIAVECDAAHGRAVTVPVPWGLGGIVPVDVSLSEGWREERVFSGDAAVENAHARCLGGRWLESPRKVCHPGRLVDIIHLHEERRVVSRYPDFSYCLGVEEELADPCLVSEREDDFSGEMESLRLQRNVELGCCVCKLFVLSMAEPDFPPCRLSWVGQQVGVVGVNGSERRELDGVNTCDKRLIFRPTSCGLLVSVGVDLPLEVIGGRSGNEDGCADRAVREWPLRDSNELDMFASILKFFNKCLSAVGEFEIEVDAVRDGVGGELYCCGVERGGECCL